MTAYTVHQPVIAAPDPLAQADQLAFVKDGFAWIALIFPFIWLLFHRMWLVLLSYSLVVAGLELAAFAFGVSEMVLGFLAVAIGIIFASEANNLRRWTLERSGYRMIAAISGDNLLTCELKFFSVWSPETLTGIASEQGIPGTLASTSELGQSYAANNRRAPKRSGFSIFGRRIP